MKKDNLINLLIIALIVIGVLSYQNYNLKKINDRGMTRLKTEIAVGLKDINSELDHIIKINDEYPLKELSLGLWIQLFKSVERVEASCDSLVFMYIKPSDEYEKVRSIHETVGSLQSFLHKTTNFVQMGESFEIAGNRKIKFKDEEDILEELLLYTELLSFFEDEEFYVSDYWQYLMKNWDIEAATYINTPIDRTW